MCQINAILVSLGFKGSIADHSLYYAQDKSHVMFVPVYVNNLSILLTVTKAMVALKTTLMNKYNMKDLEELYYCLSVEFVKDGAARTMSQAKSIEEVIKHFGIKDCKPICTPLDTNAKLMKLFDKEYGANVHRMVDVPYK